MSSRERGILIGLAIVLTAATAFIVYKAREQKKPEPGAPKPPSAWDMSRFPVLGPELREFTTPGGVLVKVYSEGKGEPVAADQAMDVVYTGYSAVSGAIFERNVLRGLMLSRGGLIPGMLEGLEGIKVREKRRLLIPAAMAYGVSGKGNIAPNSDLVFDVEWVRLEITDLRVGSGKQAKRGSKVTVHYKGTLEDGTVFDSSYPKNKPAELVIQRRKVIDGWVYGIPGMKVGGVRQLWIPAHLAYGPQSQGKIPANANLQFVVELLDVE